MAEETKIKPYEGKVVRNGTGWQVTIPAHIARYMELDKGDQVKVELTILDKAGEPKKDNTGNPKNAIIWISSADLT